MKKVILAIALLPCALFGQVVYDTTFVSPYCDTVEMDLDEVEIVCYEADTIVDTVYTYTSYATLVDSAGFALPVPVGVDAETGLVRYRQFLELVARENYIRVWYLEYFMVNGTKINVQKKYYQENPFRVFQWNESIGFTVILPAINYSLSTKDLE
jgi:hypothetical protein